MGFSNRYTRRLERSGGTYLGEKCCILPFFGFDYKKESSAYNQTVYVKNYSDPLERRSPVTRTERDFYETFYRDAKPGGKLAELENKFYDTLNDRKKEDPFKAKYIPTSLNEYYYNSSTFFEKKYRNGFFTTIFFVTIWFVLFNVFYPFVEKFMADQFAAGSGFTNMFESVEVGASVVYVLFIPIAIALIAFLLAFISEWIYDNITLGKPIDWNKIRENYFKSMKIAYGNETGEILKEYAILKGYDKIL